MGDGAPVTAVAPVTPVVNELCVVASVDETVVKLEQYDELKFFVSEKYSDEETSKTITPNY